MAAYIVIRLHTDDPRSLKEYRAATPPIVEKYHGSFLARGSAVVTLEGPSEERRVVIIEFPSLADAEAFYHSAEYAAARQLREGKAVAEFIAIEGLHP